MMIERLNILNKKTKSQLIEMLREMGLKICPSILRNCYKKNLVQIVYDIESGIQPYDYSKVILSNSYKI